MTEEREVFPLVESGLTELDERRIENQKLSYHEIWEEIGKFLHTIQAEKAFYSLAEILPNSFDDLPTWKMRLARAALGRPLVQKEIDALNHAVVFSYWKKKKEGKIRNWLYMCLREYYDGLYKFPIFKKHEYTEKNLLQMSVHYIGIAIREINKLNGGDEEWLEKKTLN